MGNLKFRAFRDFCGFKKVWGLLKGALCTVGNPFASRAVARMCREFKPDVVHFHNTFPLISPLAVRAASKYAPVVMTLHNYRTACAAGVPTRDGKVCSLCLDKKCVWDGVRHRCYRGSLLATLPLAVNIAMYRKLLPRWVKRFIVLSEFQKRKMVEYGWPEEKIVVKGNFISRVERVEYVEKKNQIVYVGRLSKEKGVDVLIKAFKFLNGQVDQEEKSTCSTRLKNLKLVIVGDGVDRQELEKQAEGLPIYFLGQKNPDVVRELLAESKVSALPSEWWETFGLTVIESMFEGTPVVVSNLGALPEIVRVSQSGEVFEAGNAEACASAIERLMNRPDYDEICAAVKHEAETKYSEEANYELLTKIYDEVVR
jgi:glycosyltransferase involved in cell wall biosynthesis